MTSKNRGPAHSKGNFKTTPTQGNFIPFAFDNLINIYCHLFFKRLVDRKNDKVKLYTIPKTNEAYRSVTQGCIRFNDSYPFLSMGLYQLFETLDYDDFDIFKEKLSDEWE